jgi:Zn-dependent protease
MKNPFALSSADEVTAVGGIFGTPLVVKGWTWLPVIPLVAWLVMAWLRARKRPARPWREHAGVAALTMPVLLGSEWCHNLAHVAAARIVGRPMDALRISLGMPLCVYYDINDASVTPREHILRSLGGPAFNLLATLAALLARKSTRPGTIIREAADVAVGTNAFLAGMSLLPIAGIDGGPILKWSLVDRGRTIAQADESVRKVDGILSGALALGSLAAARRRRWFIGGFLALMAATSFGVARGLIKE